MSAHCANHRHFSRLCPDCMAEMGLPPLASGGRAPEKKRKPNLLEEIVWDALKKSKCPQEHRYKGPSAGLPCRWCRTAHAVILILRRMAKEGIAPDAMIAEMEELAGWKLEEEGRR